MGPLDGIVVADFSRVLAGPLATMYLGDLGAEVTKVERPGAGDETRAWAPPSTPDGRSTYFLSVNRNKRSVALTLSSPEARELALRADVLVENFLPGTMERHGLGYESLALDNPRLIYASLTGFGRDAALPGYDFLVQAVGGLMSITGTPGGEPTKVGVAVVDVLAGQNLLAGVLAALYARSRTGRGQRVEVNLLSSLLSGLVNQASGVLNSATVPGLLGNAHPSIAPYQAFPALDRLVVLAVGNDAQFQRLAEVLSAPSLASDARFLTNPLRVLHREALASLLSDILRTREAADWVGLLTAAGVPCGQVNTIPEAFALATSLGLDPVVRLDGAASVANPIRLSDTPVSYRLPPPTSP